MSKFTAKPYIETVLAELSGENKAKLLNLINGKNAAGTADISYTICDSASAMAALDAGVHAVDFRFSNTILWKGYFIRTTNHKAFVTFKTGIDLWLASVYKNDGTSLIPMEKVTADNIRAILREDAYIDSSELPEPGTQVTANPTLAGTESALTGIKIGDTKYKIPVGTKLYYHKIYQGSAGAYDTYLEFIATTGESLKGNLNKLIAMIKMSGAGFDSYSSLKNANGYIIGPVLCSLYMSKGTIYSVHAASEVDNDSIKTKNFGYIQDYYSSEGIESGETSGWRMVTANLFASSNTNARNKADFYIRWYSVQDIQDSINEYGHFTRVFSKSQASMAYSSNLGTITLSETIEEL